MRILLWILKTGSPKTRDQHMLAHMSFSILSFYPSDAIPEFYSFQSEKISLVAGDDTFFEYGAQCLQLSHCVPKNLVFFL